MEIFKSNSSTSAAGSLLSSPSELSKASRGHSANRAGPQAGRSQATLLVNLAVDAGAELFHAPGGEAYATFRGQHRGTWRLKTHSFRLWLTRRFHEQTGGVPGAPALQDALGVLEGQAIFDGPEEPVAVRLAPREGSIYVDLANEQWEAVEINATGWRVVVEPPVKFRRSPGMLPLPHPVSGGRVDELRPFLNLAREDDWTLLVAWLLGALSPRGPYPMLALYGEHGSAKSTTAQLLRSLIDPNASALRAEPRELRDFMITATNCWCPVFDNLSRLQPWLSDALCRLATGGGFATRALHTDADEIIFEAQRPAMLTSIEEIVTRPDLLDRSILLELEPIAGTRRRERASVQTEFHAARPRILGALFDAITGALHHRTDAKPASLPRMADFAVWVNAAGQALGWTGGRFLAAYDENRQTANDVVLEASPLAPSLRELATRGYEGTATELLAELGKRAGDAVTRRRGWPANPRAFSGEIRRLHRICAPPGLGSSSAANPAAADGV